MPHLRMVRLRHMSRQYGVWYNTKVFVFYGGKIKSYVPPHLYEMIDHRIVVSYFGRQENSEQQG